MRLLLFSPALQKKDIPRRIETYISNWRGRQLTLRDVIKSLNSKVDINNCSQLRLLLSSPAL
ncbi:hypothetical protein HMPREF0766_11437 [Sphingobacterium spiritivorum ATCC 33861]|uniref:Uncharacterized protein n=2 Tax=Sphingobacterium spiritivorum TaxID=258 RepID=D7VKB8_SPHSI|nr:hypothetical protein HMPREF0766_11437 [Sphingobacterium spiritivorum ATCC 33861]